MSSTACLRAALASSWARPSRLVKVSAASMVEVLVGSTPRHGCCPASSSNGVWWVAEWTLLLYANSASGSQSAQLSCQWLMKTQCRQENGSMYIPPMETSFGHWNMLLLSQDENPIIGRIFCWKSQHLVL